MSAIFRRRSIRKFSDAPAPAALENMRIEAAGLGCGSLWVRVRQDRYAEREEA